jgi:hypothetical protein
VKPALLALLLGAAAPSPAPAQETLPGLGEGIGDDTGLGTGLGTGLEAGLGEGLPEIEAPAGVALSDGAILRGLDKVTGLTLDFDLAEGESARLGRITVSLGQCRYPADDPASNAYGWVTILDDAAQAPVFQGWMIAAAPALSALDHPRYDVWLIRCRLPEGATPEAAGEDQSDG